MTADAGKFTRRKLLDLFPPQPTVDELLQGVHPGRAKQYWRDAMDLLQQQDVVGYYHELEPLKAGRQAWADAWLDQPLDIRPSEDGTNAIAEIAGHARKSKRRRAKATGVRT